MPACSAFAWIKASQICILANAENATATNATTTAMDLYVDANKLGKFCCLNQN
jgi:hypothetical protein